MAKAKSNAPKVAPVHAADVPEATAFPTTFYRKHPVDAKHLNGYEARQCASADDLEKFAGWAASPADLE